MIKKQTKFNNIDVEIETESRNAKRALNEKQLFFKKQKKKQREIDDFQTTINNLQQSSRENFQQRNIYSKLQYQKNCIVLLLII